MTTAQAAAALAFNAPLLAPGREAAKQIKPGQLRISERCIAKRIIQAIDPAGAEERYFPFDPGVGQRGDDMCDLWLDRRVEPYADVQRELCIPWQFDHASGTAHSDAHVSGCAVDLAGYDYDALWEVKTSTSAVSLSDADDRRAQLEDYVRLLELNGGEAYTQDGVLYHVDPAGPARLVILHPGNYRVYGPWTIALDDDDRKRIDAGFALMDSLWARRATMDVWNDDELRAACSCSSCFPAASGEAVGDDKLLINTIAALGIEEASTKRQKDEARDLLKLRLRPGSKLYTQYANVSMSGDMDAPRLTIRLRPGAADDLAAA